MELTLVEIMLFMVPRFTLKVVKFHSLWALVCYNMPICFTINSILSKIELDFFFISLLLYVKCRNQRYKVPRRGTSDQIMLLAQISNWMEKRRPQRGI